MLLEARLNLVDEAFLVSVDLVLCFERVSALPVALLFQRVDPLMQRKLSLQVSGGSGLLFVSTDLPIQILYGLLEAGFQVCGAILEFLHCIQKILLVSIANLAQHRLDTGVRGDLQLDRCES